MKELLKQLRTERENAYKLAKIAENQGLVEISQYLEGQAAGLNEAILKIHALS